MFPRWVPFLNLFFLVFGSSKIDEAPSELPEPPKTGGEEHRISVDQLEPDLAKTIFLAVQKNPLERTTTISSLRGKRSVGQGAAAVRLADSDYELISSDFNIDPVVIRAPSTKNSPAIQTKEVFDDVADEVEQRNAGENLEGSGVGVKGRIVSLQSFENQEFVEIPAHSVDVVGVGIPPRKEILTDSSSGDQHEESLPDLGEETTTFEPTTIETPLTTTPTAIFKNLITDNELFFSTTIEPNLQDTESTDTQESGSWSVKVNRINNLKVDEQGQLENNIEEAENPVETQYLHENSQDRFDFGNGRFQSKVDGTREQVDDQFRHIKIIGFNGHGFYPQQKILDGQVEKKNFLVGSEQPNSNFDTTTTNEISPNILTGQRLRKLKRRNQQAQTALHTVPEGFRPLFQQKGISKKVKRHAIPEVSPSASQRRAQVLQEILARKTSTHQDENTKVDTVLPPRHDENSHESVEHEDFHTNPKLSSDSSTSFPKTTRGFISETELDAEYSENDHDNDELTSKDNEEPSANDDEEPEITTKKSPGINTNSLQRDLPKTEQQEKSLGELGEQKLITSVGKEIPIQAPRRIIQAQIPPQPQNFQAQLQNFQSQFRPQQNFQTQQIPQRNFFTAFRQNPPPTPQGNPPNKGSLQNQLPPLLNLPNLESGLPSTLPPVPPLPIFRPQQPPQQQVPQEQFQSQHFFNQPIALEPGTRLNIFHRDGRQFVVLDRQGQGPAQPFSLPQQQQQQFQQPPPPPLLQQRQLDLPQTPNGLFQRPRRILHEGVVRVNPNAKLVKPILTPNKIRPFPLRSDQISGSIRTSSLSITTLPPESVSTELVETLLVPDLSRETSVERTSEEHTSAQFLSSAVEQAGEQETIIPEVDTTTTSSTTTIKVTTPKPSAFPRIQFGWNELVDELNPDAVTHPTKTPGQPETTTTPAPFLALTPRAIIKLQSDYESGEDEIPIRPTNKPVLSTTSVRTITASSFSPVKIQSGKLNDEASFHAGSNVGWHDKHGWETDSHSAIYDDPISFNEDADKGSDIELIPEIPEVVTFSALGNDEFQRDFVDKKTQRIRENSGISQKSIRHFTHGEE